MSLTILQTCIFHPFWFRFGQASLAAVADTDRSDLVNDLSWFVDGGRDAQQQSIEAFRLWFLIQPSFNIRANDLWFSLLTSHIGPPSVLSEGQLISQGVFVIAIRATSSNDLQMREFAYGVVSHVQIISAEANDFGRGRKLHCLLKTFRDAVELPSSIMPSIQSVFVDDAIWSNESFSTCTSSTQSRRCA